MTDQPKRRYGKHRNETSPERIAERDRAGQALQLRKSGATYEEIAKALDYSQAAGAHNAVKRALDKIDIEPARELKLMELQRLDRLQRAHWPAATQETVKMRTKTGKVVDHQVTIAERARASSEILKIMDRRAKLCGLDEPIQIAQTVDNARSITAEEVAQFNLLWPVTVSDDIVVSDLLDE